MTHKQPLLLLLLLLLLQQQVLLLFTIASSMSPSDRASLEAIRYCLTEMPGSSSSFASWDFSHSDPCSSFSGVTCSSGRVQTLTLGPGLSGSLSPALSNLTRLTQLVLLPGLVTGPVPSQLGFLPFLRVVSFTRNRLTGSIPASFSSLVNLHTLDLSYNQLSGAIPPRLTRLPRLKVLVLASNHLSGTLDQDRVSSRLFHLDIKMNRISGPLPGLLPKSLRYLSVSNNLMCGTIEVMDSLTELTYLDLSRNKFTGTIPVSIIRPSAVLLLQRNNFTGIAASTTIRAVPRGAVVDLSHNSIAGELSGELAGAEALYLNNNELRGEVPEDYMDGVINGSTKTLYLQHNYLTRFPPLQQQGGGAAVSLCLSYNCFVSSPLGLSSCPNDAAPLRSRPSSQCA